MAAEAATITPNAAPNTDDEKAAAERNETLSATQLLSLQKISGEVLRMAQRLDHTAVDEELTALRTRIATLARRGREVYATPGAGGGSCFVGKDQTEADLYFNKIEVTAAAVAAGA